MQPQGPLQQVKPEKLTFVQGHEQGQSNRAPGGGYGDHRDSGVQGRSGAVRVPARSLCPAAKLSDS